MKPTLGQIFGLSLLGLAIILAILFYIVFHEGQSRETGGGFQFSPVRYESARFLFNCAAIKQVDGQMSPATAQHALRQAKTCAQNIVASFRGTPKNIFAFTGLGKLGSLGRRSAVAEMFGIHLKGTHRLAVLAGRLRH